MYLHRKRGATKNSRCIKQETAWLCNKQNSLRIFLQTRNVALNTFSHTDKIFCIDLMTPTSYMNKKNAFAIGKQILFLRETIMVFEQLFLKNVNAFMCFVNNWKQNVDSPYCGLWLFLNRECSWECKIWIGVIFFTFKIFLTT